MVPRWPTQGTAHVKVLAASVLVGLLGCGCSAAPGPDRSAPDNSSIELQQDAKTLAGNALGILLTDAIAASSGEADQRSQVTISNIRGAGPLSAGVACVGDGGVDLLVDGQPVRLSCASQEARTVELDRDITSGGSLVVGVDGPAPGPSAWGVVVSATGEGK